jgi:murein DD-endopeptidase MepM/ murein hydrolase activator NlpD
MSGERWTVLLMRDEGDDLRQISVSGRAVRLLTGGAGFGCVSLIVLLAVVGFRGVDSLQNVQLERQNRALVEELDELRGRVAQLQDELDDLAVKDSELRVLAGLDPIEDEVRAVGVGGPGSPVLEDHALYELDAELGKEAFATAYDLRALERRARLLRESLMEAGDSLQAHRDLLESTPSILPTSGMLTSGFSSARPHPIHNRAMPHHGVDISARRGTPIMAAAKGRVTFAGRKPGYGLMVELDHGYGYSTLYGHAAELLVRVGEEVQRGDVIAKVGSTGIATSPHLHYEVHVGGRAVNPMNYVITGAIP